MTSSTSRIGRAVRATAMSIAGAAAGCTSIAAPFDKMRDQPMTVYRLQNFEAPAQPAAQTGLPAQIQQWIAAGASLLPPGLLPPGLLQGGAAAPADAPRFHGFRILDYQPISDAAIKRDIVDAFGHPANFQNPASSCMYAEFGFAMAQPNAPTADVLVSLSCEEVQAYNFIWPYGQTGITPETSKKISWIVQRAFQGR